VIQGDGTSTLGTLVDRHPRFRLQAMRCRIDNPANLINLINLINQTNLTNQTNLINQTNPINPTQPDQPDVTPAVFAIQRTGHTHGFERKGRDHHRRQAHRASCRAGTGGARV
jgi:hypothetical protein